MVAAREMGGKEEEDREGAKEGGINEGGRV